MLVENNKSFLLIEHSGKRIDHVRLIECDKLEEDEDTGTCRITQGNDTSTLFSDFIFNGTHQAPKDLLMEKQIEDNTFAGTLHFVTVTSERLN